MGGRPLGVGGRPLGGGGRPLGVGGFPREVPRGDGDLPLGGGGRPLRGGGLPLGVGNLPPWVGGLSRPLGGDERPDLSPEEAVELGEDKFEGIGGGGRPGDPTLFGFDRGKLGGGRPRPLMEGCDGGGLLLPPRGLGLGKLGGGRPPRVTPGELRLGNPLDELGEPLDGLKLGRARGRPLARRAAPTGGGDPRGPALNPLLADPRGPKDRSSDSLPLSPLGPVLTGNARGGKPRPEPPTNGLPRPGTIQSSFIDGGGCFFFITFGDFSNAGRAL